MPLEFRCTTCNALLRVPSEQSGKLVRCPHCQQVMMAVDAEATVVAEPNPFADVLPPGPVNPYQAPSQPFEPKPAAAYAQSREAIAGRLQGPAIGMLVYGGLGLVLAVLNLVLTLTMGAENVMFGPPPANEAERIGQTIGLWAGAAVAGLVLSCVLFGAWKMLRAESYGWAMAASILSLLPCSVCCIIGLPFGIWGLVVLNDPEVKAAFFGPRRF